MMLGARRMVACRIGTVSEMTDMLARGIRYVFISRKGESLPAGVAALPWPEGFNWTRSDSPYTQFGLSKLICSVEAPSSDVAGDFFIPEGADEAAVAVPTSEFSDEAAPPLPEVDFSVLTERGADEVCNPVTRSSRWYRYMSHTVNEAQRMPKMMEPLTWALVT